ncbi:MAG: IS200/IS605 family transposase [bacterium]
MSNTYSSMFYHCVWGTKKRHPFLISPVDVMVHDLIKTVIEQHGGRVLAIGGMPDHVHVLLSKKPTVAMSLLMQYAKGSTSRLIRETYVNMGSFSWQRGTGIFSIRYSDIGIVSAYIKKQARHHDLQSFESEYRFLLSENGFEQNEIDLE